MNPFSGYNCPLLSSQLSWSECSSLVDYSREDLLAPVIPLYQQFFQEKKIRILVYSGDVDGVVPHTGTEEWLASKTLGLTVDKPFEAWKGECPFREVEVLYLVLYPTAHCSLQWASRRVPNCVQGNDIRYSQRCRTHG